MKFVKPSVRLIAKTAPCDTEIRQWLTDIGCDKETASSYAFSKQKTTGERIVELAGRRCYNSFQTGLNPNVSRIRSDIAEYIKNILSSGHGSVLEHVYFTFAIENISRVCTGELNRHRAGVAISEGSMRYIRYVDIPIVETPLLTLTAEDMNDPELVKYLSTYSDEDISGLHSIAVKKQRTRQCIERFCIHVEQFYAELQSIWRDELKPESNFKFKKHITSLIRRIIPMGIATGGVWTMNIRALRHVCTLRCSEAAEEEIAVVANRILEIMQETEPNLFGDFHANTKGYFEPEFRKV